MEKGRDKAGRDWKPSPEGHCDDTDRGRGQRTRKMTGEQEGESHESGMLWSLTVVKRCMSGAEFVAQWGEHLPSNHMDPGSILRGA